MKNCLLTFFLNSARFDVNDGIIKEFACYDKFHFRTLKNIYSLEECFYHDNSVFINTLR